MPLPMSTGAGVFVPNVFNTGINTLAESIATPLGPPSNFNQHTRCSDSMSGSHMRFAKTAAASRASAQMPTQTHRNNCSMYSGFFVKKPFHSGSRANRLNNERQSMHSCGQQYGIVGLLLNMVFSVRLLIAIFTNSFNVGRKSVFSLNSSYLAVVLSHHHLRMPLVALNSLLTSALYLDCCSFFLWPAVLSGFLTSAKVACNNIATTAKGVPSLFSLKSFRRPLKPDWRSKKDFHSSEPHSASCGALSLLSASAGGSLHVCMTHGNRWDGCTAISHSV
mmetsp:Transcript_50509/g.145590  ORF Transcript_50509/g.145590 Transcript_50509/m.145590 type:complete len:278 (+) Transcript_50509:1106-1939(+)